MFRPTDARVAVFAFAAIIVMSSALSAAQATLWLEGTVRDITGAPVQGARIEVTGPSGTITASSDTVGRYRIDGLTAGRFTVLVERAGFAPAMSTVELTTTGVSVDLTLGNVVGSEAVTVTGIAPQATLDEQTETASRLGLSVRETPATINVITFAEAQSRGLTTTNDALNRVPAVRPSVSPGQPGAVAIRGFGGGATSVSFNGTRVSTSTMVARVNDSWSFERIEVLKGPASVLFGEGALAGTVNYVSKRPDFTGRRSEALVTYGSRGAGRVAAGTTGPAGSRAAYRADAVWSTTDGTVDANQFETFAVTGALDVKLSPAVTLSTSVDYFRDEYDVVYSGTPLVPRSVARQPLDSVFDAQDFVLDKATREINYNVTDAISGSDETWVRAKLEWRMSPGWKLANEAYFHDSLKAFRRADNFTFTPATNLVARSATQILNDFLFYGNRVTIGSDTRLGGRRNRFTAGVEANRNDFESLRRFGATTAVNAYAPQRGVFPADTAQNFTRSREDFDTTLNLVSVFAEDALSVVPRLTLVGGLRYDRLFVDRAVTNANTGARSEFDTTFTPVSGRGGAVFDLMPRTQLFGQYTTAVAPVATVLLLSQPNAAFDLTTGKSWEGGVKTTTAGGRVDATASVFTIEQDNILTRDPNDPNLVVQGGTQASTGVEFTVSTEITPQLRLEGSAAFMDVRFEKLLEAGGIDRSGNAPPDVPQRTAGLWASYQFVRLPVTLAGGLTHNGHMFTNNANSTRAEAFTLLDAQATWRLGRGDVTVRGKNLTDTVWVQGSFNNGRNLLIGSPRTVDVSYHFRF